MAEMKKYFIVLLVLAGGSVFAQEKKEKVAWKLSLDPVEVVANRKFKDIGISKTEVDSLILRESVVNSLADILSQSTSLFIKNYGRGTLATVSFRGTAPSHTQVLWNGMKINSPMLGQVDFSLIPSYFIDDLTLWHGASSVNVVGGALGGAITLGTKKINREGFDLNFIQGVSSYRTYDDFLRFTCSKGALQTTTRVAYVHSDNDFKYRNYNKRDFDTTGQGKIIYPMDVNKNCNYRDLHVMQELYYDMGKNRLSFAVWYLDSKRGVPMLNVNYRSDDESKCEQKQRTVRATGQWNRYGERVKMTANAGYTFDNILYTYKGELGTDELAEMQHANSIVYTGCLKYGAEYTPAEKWLISAEVSGLFHSVSSFERTNKTGYEKRRIEASALASVRYRPTKRVGLAVNLREEFNGTTSPLIPAGYIDVVLVPKYGLILKGSIARNYHFPTLNDQYFLPGGNPDLKTEKGFTYDGGIEFSIRTGKTFSLQGEITAYNSDIDDWIVWLPTFKGFWEPQNVKRVHSYGWELKGTANLLLGDWHLFLNGNWARTRSINHGDPVNWADESIGKQLVYIPEFSSGVMGQLSWKGFAFIYKYNYFSERFTTSSNERKTKIGRLGSYYMNDISLQKDFRYRSVDFCLKVSVYNLFDEEYVSVLSRPMAGRNYGVFLRVNPHWGGKK